MTTSTPPKSNKLVVETNGPKKLYLIMLGAPNKPGSSFEPGNEETVRKIVSQYYEGYSIVEGTTGVWCGNKEQSFHIYIATTSGKTIKSVVGELKAAFKQDAILVAALDSTVNLF